MPTPVPRRWLRRSIGVAVCAVGLAGGCKSGSKTSGGGLFGGKLASRNSDPLLGGTRIPPQDLPVPGKEYGAQNKPDPLFDTGRAASRGKKTERAENDRKPPPASIPGTRPTYRPGRATTPAALAGRLDSDDGEMSIGPRPGSKAGGEMSGSGGQTYDEIVKELRDYGATWDAPDREKDTGQFVFRCSVLLSEGDGRKRWYEGVGDTEAAAAKQVLDQIKGDF
jgi:hypothetical protein